MRVSNDLTNSEFNALIWAIIFACYFCNRAKSRYFLQRSTGNDPMDERLKIAQVDEEIMRLTRNLAFQTFQQDSSVPPPLPQIDHVDKVSMRRFLEA